MSYIDRRVRVTRFTAMVVSVSFVIACTGWHTTRLRPERFRSDSSPEQVRLTLSDSTRVLARHPVLQGDSLIWMERTNNPGDSVRHAVPTGTVQRVEVRQVDGVRTVLLLLGLGFVTAVIGAASSLGDLGNR